MLRYLSLSKSNNFIVMNGNPPKKSPRFYVEITKYGDWLVPTELANAEEELALSLAC